MTATPTGKGTPEKFILWFVLALGGSFVLATLAPELLLGLFLGFTIGVLTVWRNPWGVFRFMEPEIADSTQPITPGQGGPQGSRNVTINLAGDTASPVVKIPCKHCGTMVDIVQNSSCPKCGAPVK